MRGKKVKAIRKILREKSPGGTINVTLYKAAKRSTKGIPIKQLLK